MKAGPLNSKLKTPNDSVCNRTVPHESLFFHAISRCGSMDYVVSSQNVRTPSSFVVYSTWNHQSSASYTEPDTDNFDIFSDD